MELRVGPIDKSNLSIVDGSAYMHDAHVKLMDVFSARVVVELLTNDIFVSVFL